jgi:hypothetical protein
MKHGDQVPAFQNGLTLFLRRDAFDAKPDPAPHGRV